MIRRGGYTTGTSDVLSGTQFSTLTRQQRLRVRAKQMVGGTTGSGVHAFDGASMATLTLEDSVLCKQVIRQQSAITAKDAEVAQNEGEGPTDDDILFDGIAGPGNLLLSFDKAASGAGVVWDITAY